ncbi:phytase [Gymnopus androsaceus JB14]|uniref:Phytase A n=1 Tax=Gymnopus androsaceus JB14 TaxID=1447944 RepID=A0A6A4HR37_9AGAR|nr:phytase [Gymnopus androsaceus JB14]
MDSQLYPKNTTVNPNLRFHWTSLVEKTKKSLRLTIAFLVLSAAISIYLFPSQCSVGQQNPQKQSPINVEFSPLVRNWGAYAPYYPLDEYTNPPRDCEITQVNILQRHGARYPTVGPAAMMASAVAKLQNVKTYHDSSLDFIRNYTFDLGTDELVAFGATQSSIAGAEIFHRYSQLLAGNNPEDVPFVRASSSSRVVMSARNWTYGFSVASDFQLNPVLSVILDAKENDTLHNDCPAIGSPDNQTDTWIDIYVPPIAERINTFAPGANLSANEVYYLMALCPFHSVATEDISDWCGLFSEKEWTEFEYEMDLDKYYGTGYGQALGPVEGVGYINELIARLTSTPVNDTTQTNTTLDASPITFPLNRTIYADFSHDNQLIAIYSAMGLFKQPRPLDPTNPHSNGPNWTWVTSRLAPFGGRMVIEKMRCERTELEQFHQDSNSTEFIRILVNDAVQPLEFCAEVTMDGLCALDKFVESQWYSTSGGAGDWEKCFE